ncbi:MAG TPA: ATP synthase F0 subunit B [Polyangiales bacterium]|nr:ATP synthase F0 subunit B [Polyangiales bacterium]
MQLSAFLSVLLEGSIIDLDGTVFVQFAMFSIAFVILYALVFKPMVRLLDARDVAIEGSKQEAKHLETEVQQKQAQFEAELRRVQTAAGEERERLRGEGQERERALLDRVRVETQQLVAEGKSRLETEARIARAELSAQRNELAREIASRVLGREVQG